jgi:hypothetical protein
MLKAIKTLILDSLKKIKYYKCLPKHIRSSDVYIVEFPKSGITWFSTLVTNVNLLISGSSQRATYYNIQQFIPDIHMGKDIYDSPLWNNPLNRYIKSHCEYCPFYLHVIYVVRNPVSVMNSYYQYSTMLGKYRGSLKDFVLHPHFGIDAWISHVSGWLDRGDSSQRIHMIRYEDLSSEPILALNNLYKNLGIKVNIDIIQEAVNQSCFENMQESENHYKKFNPNVNLKFVREGIYKANIDLEAEKIVLERTEDIRKKLGY